MALPSTPSAPLPQLPSAPQQAPVFGQQPVGSKPKVKNQQTTFLGGQDVASPGNLGGKQLLGQ
jgi:hypothetical protein